MEKTDIKDNTWEYDDIHEYYEPMREAACVWGVQVSEKYRIDNPEGISSSKEE